MRSGIIGKIGGEVRRLLRAVWRFTRRVVPPMAMAATLLTLGFLAWPEGNTRIDSNLDAAGTETAAAPTTRTVVAPLAGKAVQTLGDSAGDGEAEEKASAETSETPSTTTVPPTCFEPLFRDDFDSDVLDPAWTVYDSKGNHSRHAVRRADAVTLEDGNLVITARNDENGVAASGGIRLEHPQVYGRYAFRVRTDPDPARATSGVILTWPVSESQPRDGENNIYETLPGADERRPFYSFIHEPFDAEADGISQTEFVHLGDATEWQEMAMDWTPEYLEISWVDPATGKLQSKRLTETSRDLITDAEHFLAIQLDLFRGALVDGDTVRMEVDWVEVHSYCGG